MNPNRRKMLAHSAGVALAGAFGMSRLPTAFASEATDQLIKDFGGDVTPGTGSITLKTPEIAENCNSVPVSVTVDNPMTDDNYVESIMILADGNPNPEVATLHFTPASGKAQASTRMRLAKTQNIIAVAKLSDGSLVSTTNEVKVTIGGCGG